MAIFSGSSGADTITPAFVSPGVLRNPPNAFPTGAQDIILGGGGDDVIDGGGGPDQIDGGAGSDTITVRGIGSYDGGSGFSDSDLFVVVAAGFGTTIDGFDYRFDAQGALTITGAVIEGAGSLLLDSATLTLTNTQLIDFVGPIRADDGATLGRLAVSGGVDQFGTLAVLELSTLEVTGSADRELLDFTAPDATAIVAAGLGGRDTIRGGLGGDSFAGGTDDDILEGREGRDTLDGGDQDDRLSGGAERDLLFGGAGDDFLEGEGGRDRLVGGVGSERLIGGAGNDILTGGAGQDFFQYNNKIPAGFDRITDFQRGTDHFLIALFEEFGNALDPSQLAVNANGVTTAPAGTAQFVFATSTSTLFLDLDGAGGDAAKAVAVLVGIASLSVSDFAFI